MNIRWVALSLLWLVIGFCGSGSMCSSAAGQSTGSSGGELKDNPNPEDVVIVNCVAKIERLLDVDFNPHYSADVSGIVLDAAMKYRLRIKVVNPYDTTIQFSRVALSCGCAKFETDQKEIPTHGSADFVMDLVARNDTGFPLGRVTATFYSIHTEFTPSFKLNVNYRLQGAFGFNNNQVIVEVPKDQAVVVAKLPIVLVEPVTLEMLELKYSENLRDFKIHIVSDVPEGTAPFVEIGVAREAVSRQGLTGEVGLRRIGSDQFAGVTLSLRHQDTFALRPESLRLSRDNHSKPYQAFAVLRIHETGRAEKKVHEGDSKPATLSTPEVALSIDGKPANVRVQRMGQSGVYRLTIQHDGPFEADADGLVSVSWRVLVHGEERVIESHAFVPDR